MAAKRLPPLESIKKGQDLRFVRQVRIYPDEDLFFSKNRTVYVAEVGEHGLSLIILHKPLKNPEGFVSDETFNWKGFKWCMFVDTRVLLNNCRRVK